ncbi:MAG TPA: hypothetical protein VFV38_43315, partial [Ktedonobacteraceae bacterium]|nr:hypothetical protein [Ktedonobacteraceae bacterium]
AFPHDSQQAAVPSPLPQQHSSSRSTEQSTGQTTVPRNGSSTPLPEGGFPQHWMVPYRHNPYFVAPKQALQRLHRGFRTSSPTLSSPIQAITGLGGMGKTQLATEYAFTYRSTYPQGIFWVRADSSAALLADYLALAERENVLPMSTLAHDPDQMVKVITTWFRDHGEWLLVLDNADNLALVGPFLPSAYQGARSAHDPGRRDGRYRPRRCSEQALGRRRGTLPAREIEAGSPWNASSSGTRNPADARPAYRRTVRWAAVGPGSGRSVYRGNGMRTLRFPRDLRVPSSPGAPRAWWSGSIAWS